MISTPSARNVLLATDMYKMGHMEQYAPGTTKVYSYLMARSDKNYEEVKFFGLNHWLSYLCSSNFPNLVDVLEFIQTRDSILGDPGSPASLRCYEKLESLVRLGYWPLRVKAVPEGNVVPVKNVLATVTNTHPEFYWTVGFVESLLLKVWDAASTATCSHYYRKLAQRFFDETVDRESHFLLDYTVHDFGYRGCSSEEQAAITGAAHLLSFAGSDTVPAAVYTSHYPGTRPPIFKKAASVPASEHSVMCSFGREDELAAFRSMLRLYSSGFVSIVSDTYDVYKVLTEFAEKLKPEILARDGKVVFRPDSGNPEHIICGDPGAAPGSPEELGAIRLLERCFGSTVNNKGYKILNPKVGLIYGDGMYLARYERTLQRLKDLGFAASNLVIGVGGILRNHSRDSLGFALKATYVERNGDQVEIEKTPVTDPGKKSHKGLLQLRLGHKGEYLTKDRCSPEEEAGGLLETVFENGRFV